MELGDIPDSPYYIQGDITIPNDSTLTIEAGVLVEFQGHYALNVQGQLLAIGTDTNIITFTVTIQLDFIIRELHLVGGMEFNLLILQLVMIPPKLFIAPYNTERLLAQVLPIMQVVQFSFQILTKH